MHYDVLLRCDETSAQALRAAPFEEVRSATIALLDAMATAAVEDDPLVFVGLTLGEAGHPIDRDALRWVEREPTELRVGLAAHLLTGFWRSCEEPPGWNELGRLLTLMKRGSPTAPGGTAVTRALTSAAARSDLGAAVRVKVSDELSGWEHTTGTSISGSPVEPMGPRIRTGARHYLKKAVHYDRIATLSALRDLCRTCDQAASFTGRFETHATGLGAILRCASCEVDVPVWDQRTEGLLNAWVAEVIDSDDRQHLEGRSRPCEPAGQRSPRCSKGGGASLSSARMRSTSTPPRPPAGSSCSSPRVAGCRCPRPRAAGARRFEPPPATGRARCSGWCPSRASSGSAAASPR